MLYGKFGTDNKVRSKIPEFIDGKIHYQLGDYEERDGIYVALASFITSNARLITISSAQKITDDYNAGISDIQFVYADTDSLHCISPNFELPQGLEIDSTKLGAWDFESKFAKGTASIFKFGERQTHEAFIEFFTFVKENKYFYKAFLQMVNLKE